MFNLIIECVSIHMYKYMEISLDMYIYIHIYAYTCAQHWYSVISITFFNAKTKRNFAIELTFVSKQQRIIILIFRCCFSSVGAREQCQERLRRGNFVDDFLHAVPSEIYRRDYWTYKNVSLSFFLLFLQPICGCDEDPSPWWTTPLVPGRSAK